VVKAWKAIRYSCISNQELDWDKESLFYYKILTDLCQCWLGAKNLDLLILLIKNWHDDLTPGFEDRIGLVDLDRFSEAKVNILDVIDFEFPHEV
jgi:hypothetical protein